MVSNNLNNYIKTKINNSFNIEKSILQILEKTSIGACIFDLKENIIDTNKIYQNFLGYSENEINELSLKNITFPGFYNQVYQAFQDLIQLQKDSIHINQCYISKRGEKIWVKTILTLIKDNNNSPLFIICIADNISNTNMAHKRKTFLNLLKEKINKTNNLKECTQLICDYIKNYTSIDSIGIRLKNNNDFPYCSTNGFEYVFIDIENSLCPKKNNLNEQTELECLCGAIITENTNLLIPFFTEYGSFWTNNISDVLSPELFKNQNIKIRNMCGLQGYKSIALIPLKNCHETIGLLQLNSYKPNQFSIEQIYFLENICSYISQIIQCNQMNEKYIEEKILLNKKIDKNKTNIQESLKKLSEAKMQLEIASNQKDQFLYCLSHELRTPLTVIMGFSKVLEQQYFGTLNEKQREYISLINSSGNHLVRIINEILDISKIDSGIIEFSKEKCSVYKLFNEAMSLMSLKFNEKNIVINFNIEPEAHSFLGDMHKCRQIMINLLNNAFKFTHSGGRVTLYAEKTIDNKIKLSIKDTGRGIKEEDKKKIFSEFYQAHPCQDRELGGLGLGLALCKRFVKLQGGEIGVESELNYGSTFWFTLPLPDITQP